MPQDRYTDLGHPLWYNKRQHLFMLYLYMTLTVMSHFLSSTLIESKSGSTANAVVNIHLEMVIIASSYSFFHLSCTISR